MMSPKQPADENTMKPKKYSDVPKLYGDAPTFMGCPAVHSLDDLKGPMLLFWVYRSTGCHVPGRCNAACSAVYPEVFASLGQLQPEHRPRHFKKDQAGRLWDVDIVPGNEAEVIAEWRNG